MKNFIGLSLFFLAFSNFLHAQNFPFVQRRTWDGPFDIRMIAAPNLEAVYINSAQAATGRLRADSLIKHSTMLMTETLLNTNNRYDGGTNANPFQLIEGISKAAVSCPNPNIPCFAGIGQPVNPNAACPGGRYLDPEEIPDVYASMTYADYDADLSTYSSSMAELDISACAEIESAFLYWAGSLQITNLPAITLVPGPTSTYNGNGNVFNTSATSGYQTVRFRTPTQGYQDVTATPANTKSSNGKYLCVADVTAQMRGTGKGQFWVGNIQSYPNQTSSGSASGWVLVVIFRSPLSPPRLISLWDGLNNVVQYGSESFPLDGLQAPATNNFKSYVGFAVLDGENLAAEIIGTAPEGIGFKTNNGPQVNINPFRNEQDAYKLWTEDGYPARANGSKNIDACNKPLFDANWASVYDGISSSKITSYNEVTNKNGNEIVRLPSNPNTLGLDAHHIKLPDGAVTPGATEATLTVNAGPQGGTIPFMAYIAIEKLQPKLELTKTANKNFTTLDTEITYKLTLKNKGNTASRGGDVIFDTLDLATTFVPGSLVAPTGVTVTEGSSNSIQIANIPIINIAPARDSIEITFRVRVKEYTNNQQLWDIQCKRSITNVAYIRYNIEGGGTLQNRSNANDCGIGSEVKILIVDDQLNAANRRIIGPLDASGYLTESVLAHVRQELIAAGVAAADVNLYDIRQDTTFLRIRPETVFPTTGGEAWYLAIRNYDVAVSGNCQEVFLIKFTFGDIPNFTRDTTHVSCYQLKDGSIRATAIFSKPTSKIAYAVVAGKITTDTEFATATRIRSQASSSDLAIVETGLPKGLYTIVATDETNANYYLAYEVFEPAQINASVTSTPVCAGASSSISISNPSGGPVGGSITFSWESSPDQITWTTAGSDQTINSTLIASTYFRSVVTKGVCRDTFGGLATVNALPMVSAGNARSICTGESATLTATGASSYTWDQGIGNGNNITVSPTVQTTYMVTGTASNNCINTGTVVISVGDLNILNAGNDTTLCETSTAVQLNGKATSGSTILWSGSNGTFTNPNNLNASYTPSAQDKSAGSVKLYLTTSGISCGQPKDSIEIVFVAQPNVGVTDPTKNLCTNNYSTTLDGTWNQKGSILWKTNGDGKFSPNATALDAQYVPGSQDTISTKSIVLTLTAIALAPCVNSTVDKTLNYEKAPTVDAGDANPVCASVGIAALSGASNSTILWSGGSGVFSPDANSKSVNYNLSAIEKLGDNITFKITTTGHSTCPEISDDVTLPLTPDPTINADQPASVCANDSVIGLDGTMQYALKAAWSGGLGGSFELTSDGTDGKYIPSAADISSGTATLTIKNLPAGNGCPEATKSITILIHPKPVVSAGYDSTHCSYPVFQLKGDTSRAAGFIWKSAGGGTFTNANTLSPKFTMSALEYQAKQAIVTIEATAPTCKPVRSIVTLKLQGLPSVQGVDQVSCQGNTAILAVDNAKSNASTYYWFTKDGTQISNAASLAITATKDTSFLLVGVSNDSCGVSDEVTLNTIFLPVIGLGDTSLCSGSNPVSLSARITNLETGILSSFQWKHNNVILNAATTQSLSTNKGGNYTIVVTIAGCTAEKSAIVTEHSLPSPVINDTRVCPDTGLAKLILPPVYQNYVWKDLKNNQQLKSGIENFVIVNGGNYEVTVTDKYGCSNSDKAMVYESCAPSIYIPTAFSPNEDKVNEGFRVFHKHISKFKMIIFNRWGEIIYESSNIDTAWDSFYRDLKMPMGVYPYMITYEGDNADYRGPFKKEGSITLVR